MPKRKHDQGEDENAAKRYKPSDQASFPLTVVADPHAVDYWETGATRRTSHVLAATRPSCTVDTGVVDIVQFSLLRHLGEAELKALALTCTETRQLVCMLRMWTDLHAVLSCKDLIVARLVARMSLRQATVCIDVYLSQFASHAAHPALACAAAVACFGWSMALRAASLSAHDCSDFRASLAPHFVSAGLLLHQSCAAAHIEAHGIRPMSVVASNQVGTCYDNVFAVAGVHADHGLAVLAALSTVRTKDQTRTVFGPDDASLKRCSDLIDVLDDDVRSRAARDHLVRLMGHHQDAGLGRRSAGKRVRGTVRSVLHDRKSFGRWSLVPTTSTVGALKLMRAGTPYDFAVTLFVYDTTRGKEVLLGGVYIKESDEIRCALATTAFCHVQSAGTQ